MDGVTLLRSSECGISILGYPHKSWSSNTTPLLTSDAPTYCVYIQHVHTHIHTYSQAHKLSVHMHTHGHPHIHTHTHKVRITHTFTFALLSLSLSLAGTDSGSVSGTRWPSLRNQTLSSEHWLAKGSQGVKEKEG